MFSRKIFGIMIILLLAAGIAITTTRCYDDKNEARVTIHLERNDLAAMGIQPQKHFIDKVLEFFSTPAYAVFGWDGTHYALTLSVSSPSFETFTFNIPLGVTQYSLIIPSGNNTIFTATCVSITGGGYKNWGGEKIIDLGPGEQDLQLTILPMVNLGVSSDTSTVYLSWDSSSDFTGTQSYNLYRSTEIDGKYSFLKNIVDTTTPNTTDVKPVSGRYYYKLSVVTTYGEGVKSDPKTWL